MLESLTKEVSMGADQKRVTGKKTSDTMDKKDSSGKTRRRAQPRDKPMSAAEAAGFGVCTEEYVRGADKRTKELFHLACIL